MPELFHRLPRNVLAIFSGRNLGWQALAIVLTAGIVMSGFDWSYYRATRSDFLLHLARPAIMFGSALPILGTLALLIIGEAIKNRRIITTAWALGQSAILGFLISSGYKAFTGRIPPPHSWGSTMSGPALIDTSHGFQFGFLRGGVFWGWPSSHTTIAFAMAMTLFTLYPKQRWLGVLAIVYACYVGLGVSMTIHWFSDFAAGAIVGSVIGVVVGRSFGETSNTERRTSNAE